MSQPEEEAEVIIGMRPEHFGAPDARSNGAAAVFELPIQYTERTGSDATGYLRFEEGLLSLRLEPGHATRLDQGQKVTVAFPHGKANVFDALSGKRL